MSGFRIGSLLTGIGLLAVLLVFGTPVRHVQAQGPEDPTATPGALTFYKHCEDGLTGPFLLFLDFEFEPDGIVMNGFDEDEAFDRFVLIECGMNEVLSADDLAEVTAFVADVCSGNDCPPGFDGSIRLLEVGLPAGTTSDFTGNFEGICDGTNTLDIVDQSGALEDFFGGTGLLCEITNEPPPTDGVCCPGGNIDIDNNNTNTIDIDNTNTNTNTNVNNNINENKNINTNVNNNVNTNTQNQSNNQSQNNSNTQTNNINSSPKVNIFD